MTLLLKAKAHPCGAVIALGFPKTLTVTLLLAKNGKNGSRGWGNGLARWSPSLVVVFLWLKDDALVGIQIYPRVRRALARLGPTLAVIALRPLLGLKCLPPNPPTQQQNRSH